MKLPYQTVFVDTSFLIALLRSNDSDHAKALALYQQVKAAKIRKMTSEYVLLELGNGLSRLGARRLAVDFFNQIYYDNSFEIVPALPPRYSLTHWRCSKHVRIRNGDWWIALPSLSCKGTKLTQRYRRTIIFDRRAFGPCC